jgi:hypothetical protein
MASRDTLGMDEEQKRDRARSVRSNARMGAHQLKLLLSIGKAPPRVRDGFEGDRLSSPVSRTEALIRTSGTSVPRAVPRPADTPPA